MPEPIVPASAQSDSLHDGYRYNGEEGQKLWVSPVEELKPPDKKPPRPVIIDPNDGACELCAAHTRGICDRCGSTDLFGDEMTPSIQNMHGNGYQSIKPGHYHLAPVMGIAGRECHWDELCLDCYRKEYEAVYNEAAPC